MRLHVRILDAVEVDPDVRVLVPEQGREAQMGLPVERAPLVRSSPLGPGGGIDRVRGRAEREDVEDHRLVVAAPVVSEKARFRVPAQRHDGRARGEPLPVGARVDRVGESADLGFGRVGGVAEVRLAEQHSAQEQRGVDARELDLLIAGSRIHVEEVIEEAVVAGRRGRRVLTRGPEEAEGGDHPLPCLVARDVPVLDADRVGGEPESDGGDAREGRGGGAVGDEPVGRVGQVPEIVERVRLDGIEECCRLGRVRWGRALRVVSGAGGEQGPRQPGNGRSHGRRIIAVPASARATGARTGSPRKANIRSGTLRRSACDADR